MGIPVYKPTGISPYFPNEIALGEGGVMDGRFSNEFDPSDAWPIFVHMCVAAPLSEAGLPHYRCFDSLQNL